jgi:hypothetical protein
MMFQTTLGAVFVQVALTFALMIWMMSARTGSLKRGEEGVRSQFELPMLFYVLVALALILRKADLIFAVLAWLFVLTRLVHAYVQTTSNHVPTRAQAYAAGAIILMVMWGYFAVQVLFHIP